MRVPQNVENMMACGTTWSQVPSMHATSRPSGTQGAVRAPMRHRRHLHGVGAHAAQVLQDESGARTTWNRTVQSWWA